jgi:hypothetical protein
MLPVSAWPPGPPGASLSPFGQPRQVAVPSFGFVIPQGAWIVSTGSNQVVMFFPPVVHSNPPRTPGTGLLPGQVPPTSPPCGCPPNDVWRPTFRKFNDTPLQPPGRRPPNWFGWRFVPAPFSTLVPAGSTGQLVIADGQNVVITGGGFAQITQAYSV